MSASVLQRQFKLVVAGRRGLARLPRTSLQPTSSSGLAGIFSSWSAGTPKRLVAMSGARGLLGVLYRVTFGEVFRSSVNLHQLGSGAAAR